MFETSKANFSLMAAMRLKDDHEIVGTTLTCTSAQFLKLTLAVAQISPSSSGHISLVTGANISAAVRIGAHGSTSFRNQEVCHGAD